MVASDSSMAVIGGCYEAGEGWGSWAQVGGDESGKRCRKYRSGGRALLRHCGVVGRIRSFCARNVSLSVCQRAFGIREKKRRWRRGRGIFGGGHWWALDAGLKLCSSVCQFVKDRLVRAGPTNWSRNHAEAAHLFG